MDRAIAELREDLEHGKDRRFALIGSVRKYRKYREADRAKDRGDDALLQLQVERNVRSLVDELAKARWEISQLISISLLVATRLKV